MEKFHYNVADQLSNEIDERKKTEYLLASENKILEQIAQGNPLFQILEEICNLIEKTNAGTHCSILILDQSQDRLMRGAAPSLPLSLNVPVKGIPAVPDAGPCGLAAYLKEPVISANISLDDRWDSYGWRTIAAEHKMQALCSTPILSSNKDVLGTFAIYFNDRGDPTARYRKIIDQFTHLASIAIESATDITERRHAEEKLRRSEAYLAEAQKLSRTGSFGWKVSNNELFWSEETFRITEYDKAVKPTLELLLNRVHPDDISFVKQVISRASAGSQDMNFGHRFLMADGSVKYVHVMAHVAKDKLPELEYIGAVTDITAAKIAEEKIREKENEFRQIVEAIPALIIVLNGDGSYLYANQRVLEYTGCTQEDVVSGNFRELVFHPDDVERLKLDRAQALSKGIPFEMEQRMLRKDGQYRWFLTRLSPLLSELGKVIRWYATGTDIHALKQEEERVKKENIALREEIGTSSRFEIIGSSGQMKNIFHLMSLVAFTNSSVLILGETGTGKELIARAIHNHSNRKDKVMIKVNCATLPASLIESELFGHEKGSFTGAIERRIGKFELANNSTLFLDEIGELPLELQVKLLHAIQEKEIERVGGKEIIKTDVRIVAATNRDLPNEVKNGNFRSDLYYRLNVFPITVPPLRERKEDIPALASAFLSRFTKNIGKKITGFSPEVIEELINYNWPGNVRELEHLVERSVILNDSDTIKELHLPFSEKKNLTGASMDISIKTIYENEREHILSVLKKCNGKVSGPVGAAALLGVPVSTLNSKIKKLEITKENIFSKK